MVCSGLLTQVGRVRWQGSLCGICDRRNSSTETYLSPSASVIPQQLLICHVLGGYSPNCHGRDPVSFPGSSYGIYDGPRRTGTSFAPSTSHFFRHELSTGSPCTFIQLSSTFYISVTETVVRYQTKKYHLLFHQWP